MQTQDYWQQVDARGAEQARVRQQNVELFTRMFLALGPDAMKLDGNTHDAEMMEAKALAAARWFRLLEAEAQAQRDEAALASRPKKRPAQPGDDVLPDRTLAQRDAEWVDATKYKQGALAELRDQVKTERRTLESFVVKRK